MTNFKLSAIALAIAAVAPAHAASITGPSSSQAPYLQAVAPNVDIGSVLTSGDLVGSYRMGGIPDGLGAFDNGNGTFTLLMNHELGDTLGVTRAHGAIGSYVSEWVINKSDFSVVSGRDLIQSVYTWDTATQSSSLTPTVVSFNRFCSADLAPVSAFYNPTSGLGTQSRIFMNGDESGSTGLAMAHVATGAGAGNSFVLGKFNTDTNGSGGTDHGGWENLLANPLAQDRTVVIGNNDGGSGIMRNALAVYVGTKTNAGTDADRAGLTNGTTKFVNLDGFAAEAPDADRHTAITNGTRFTLSDSASTVFSRPEDGAWNPNNPNEYYFVTTDTRDTTDLTGGTSKGGTRLWRLTFDDITNPDAGGKIDILIDSSNMPGGVGVDKPNMFDNISANADGTITLLEDVGGADHNGKVWQFDPASGQLTMLAKFDPALFGDIVNGSFVAGTHTNDEETSGVIDLTNVLGFNDGASYRLLVAQDHSDAQHLIDIGAMDPNANPAEMIEGGQLLVMRIAPVPEPETYALMAAGLGIVGAAAARRRKHK